MALHEKSDEAARKRRRAASRTAWLAIIHSALVFAAYYLLSSAPEVTASDAEFTEFYASPSNQSALLVAGLYLMPFAGIAFMWFIVALRIWIRRTSGALRDEFYSSGQLVSGIVFLALFLTASASISVLAVGLDAEFGDIDAQTARQFTEMGWALIVVFAMRMAAVFIITTSVLGRRHRFLPVWFVVLGFVIGVALLLSASVSSLLVLVMPLWMLLLGALLMLRAWTSPETLVGGLVSVEPENT